MLTLTAMLAATHSNRHKDLHYSTRPIEMVGFLWSDLSVRTAESLQIQPP